ncbi:Phage protein Gp19/Gp15/Gp42 [Amycolatopsis marina]|uniref:Phage protein Gp19/Gp15/Gp42 n=2 Tax=Amycolatopsis marina TaxID=490629 RepID=A0A1I1CJW1_9PSEU|nr:Phage protein Gp19/Gp15/Gp42 [Amycolatopsis marina]
MPLASTLDVEARLGRPLTDDERTQALTLLSDAELILLARVPDLRTNLDRLESAIMIEANMVLRVLRNPDAFVSENDGNYGYQRAYAEPQGRLWVTDDEWKILGVGVGVFVLQPDFTPYQGLV